MVESDHHEGQITKVAAANDKEASKFPHSPSSAIITTSEIISTHM
jgi:hypothetical protein